MRGKRLAIIEDDYDSGGTGQRMLNDAPYATILFLTEKINVENQIPLNQKLSVVKIDDKYIGGWGLNVNTPGDGLPEDFLRDYPGIVAKII